jgi:hypothetical protein
MAFSKVVASIGPLPDGRPAHPESMATTIAQALSRRRLAKLGTTVRTPYFRLRAGSAAGPKKIPAKTPIFSIRSLA